MLRGSAPAREGDAGLIPVGLVLDINEVYHDVEAEWYERRHPEIVAHEAARWRRLADAFVPRHAVSVLDLGTGTGFVALQLLPRLGADSRLICADISARMLALCGRRIDAAGGACPVRYLKVKGQQLDLPAAHVDVITLNSTLHHLPDLAESAREIDRVLKPGGRLVVVHEPNRRFLANRVLRDTYRAIYYVFHPVPLGLAALRRAGLGALSARLGTRMLRASGSVDIAAEVNRRLLARGAIARPLTPPEITELVDIHSPMGSSHPERGFDARDVAARHFPGYAVRHVETYNHLGSLSADNVVTRALDRWLARRYPEDGAEVAFVLEKPAA